MQRAAPVVLDFDGSVGLLPGERHLDLKSWQESIRFGCGLGLFKALGQLLEQRMPPAQEHGTVFTGSGDFHHLSWPLIQRQLRAHPHRRLRVVVLDNHPDNMRFPWGVHCGSWVRRVAMLQQVSHVHVVGITSQDIGVRHAWENYLAPLCRGKLSYWSVGVDTAWSRWLGMARAFRNFPSIDALIDALCTLLAREHQPTYLSIDKDVFAPDVARTNWDQGQLLPRHMARVIDALRWQMVASDVTGDVSSHRYTTRWKRWLSAGDGQDTRIPTRRLAQWQAEHAELNEWLLMRLDAVRVVQFH